MEQDLLIAKISSSLISGTDLSKPQLNQKNSIPITPTNSELASSLAVLPPPPFEF
jgi:hypothetical protein